MPKKKKFKVTTLAECEKAIGIPAAEWPTRCHEISVAVNRALNLGCQECYGAYYGPVNPGGPFNPDQPIQRHGWLKTPDNKILDVTRWVFEQKPPYIFCDYDNDGHYDLGMERLHVGLRQDRPPPADDAHPKKFKFDLADADAALFVSEIFDAYPTLNLMQVGHLANMGPGELGKNAKPIYEKIVELGLSAFIPIDFQTAVLRGGRY